MIDLYFQPYGDEQQLNLNWIINEIINLHKQLDPDYETPSFTQVYPYSNLNRLNLDWVLSELKALKELAPEPTPAIDIQAVAEALVALPFDSTKSYQVYDYISRDGEIWRATEAITAGGVWDETKWFKTKIGTDLAVLERWINAINNSLTSLQNTVANLSSADISDDSDAGGATVKASLNNLKSAVDTLENDLDGLTSADISDDSDAGGATVKASLNNLKSSLTAIENDVTDIQTDLTVTAVPRTYTQNNYVPSNSFLGGQFKKAGIVVFSINIRITTALPDQVTGVEIGRLNLGFTPAGSSMITIPPQSNAENNGNIILVVDSNGIVTIGNTSGKPCNGFYRSSLTIF